MIILAWAFLLLLPLLLGLGIMTIVYRKKTRCFIGLSDCYITGLIACIGIAFVVHVLGYFSDTSLRRLGLFLLLLLLSVTIIGALIGLAGVLKRKQNYFVRRNRESMSGFLPLAFLGILLVQLLYVFCKNPLVIPGDITLETVQSFLTEDGIYRVLPLTGMPNESGVPLRYAVLCLPTFYAVLALGFGLDPELVVCHMVPVVMLGATYLAYERFGESLFGTEQRKKKYWFLIMVSLLLFFSEGSVFLDGYGALHAGYLGTSIRNLILVPYTISVMLEKQYWKAVLCILAELCICWTFWGCGVCLALSLGILILSVCERRIPKLGKILQIFRRKEEQL